MRSRVFFLLSGFLLLLLLGYYLAGSAVPAAKPKLQSTSRTSADETNSHLRNESVPNYKSENRPVGSQSDEEANAQGALVGQRAVTFKDQASMDEFIKNASDRGLMVLGRIDALLTLRIGFFDSRNLLSALDGSEELSMIFPVTYPEDGSVPAQAGAVGFGSQLLDWLGINTDHSSWGKGVKIAVLDTGVADHSSFTTSIIPVAFGTQAAVAGDANGHGTAVASMIIGTDPRLPGVAPASTILSVPIADANGYSDSYAMAQGIIAAVDAGADLINISMASSGDSGVVRNALSYAQERGVLVVAAAGNNGADSLAYPSANTGVVSVGAVDANYQHLDFSNSGDTLAMAAPGYGINAAWTDDRGMAVSGTSFSSPIVTGLVAATMTSGNQSLSATQAYQLLASNLNEAGAPGYDPQIGAGVPNMGRVLNSGTSGIYDAAVASNWITSSNGSTKVQIVIQNRGTETLVNTGASVTVGGATSNLNITTLAPGAIRTFDLPVPHTASSVRVDSQVYLSNGTTDANRGNDRRLETLIVPQN